MLAIGSSWHEAQDLPAAPSTSSQLSSAWSTKIIPGLSKSSICSGWVSSLRYTQPEE